MKRLLGIFALSALTTSLFGQGQIQFNNLQATGPVKAWTSGSDSNLVSVPKTTGTTVNGRIEVLAVYNSSNASLTPLFTPVAGKGVTTTYSTMSAFLNANTGWAEISTVPMTSLQPGVFNALVLTIGSSNPGAPVSYAIAGWTGSFTTWDLAYASRTSFMGISPVYTIASANPLTTPPGVPPTISDTFAGMTLAPVVVIPEPASFALAGLGLAALLAFRRRNS